jgi:hypothetical protein
MAYYRLYFLDRHNHIEHFREFEANTDKTAIEQGSEWRDLNAMELWSGRRRVMSWSALGASPEARARSALRALRIGEA